MRIKARMEFQLELGDKVSGPEAVAEAAKDFAEQLMSQNFETFSTANTLDVPRGKMAFIIEKG